MPGMMDMLVQQMTGMAPQGGGMPGPGGPPGGGGGMPGPPGAGMPPAAGFGSNDPTGWGRMTGDQVQPGPGQMIRSRLMQSCQGGDMNACRELMSMDKQQQQQQDASAAPGGWGMSSRG